MTERAPFRGRVGSTHPSGKCMSIVCLEPKDIDKLLNGGLSREIAQNKAALNLLQRHCKAPADNNKKHLRGIVASGSPDSPSTFAFSQDYSERMKRLLKQILN